MFGKVVRGWGHYRVLLRTHKLCIKILTFLPGRHMTMQRHFKRTELWIRLWGYGSPEGWMMIYPPWRWHDYVCITRSVFIEIQWGEPTEEDIERK